MFRINGTTKGSPIPLFFLLWAWIRLTQGPFWCQGRMRQCGTGANNSGLNNRLIVPLISLAPFIYLVSLSYFSILQFVSRLFMKSTPINWLSSHVHPYLPCDLHVIEWQVMQSSALPSLMVANRIGRRFCYHSFSLRVVDHFHRCTLLRWLKCDVTPATGSIYHVISITGSGMTIGL